MSDPNRKPNRLVHEPSPYLQQHAYNPVDWYPWGGEALTKAEQDNKPIFLSIGYSACHWCHVMERESFENEDIARQLNEHFVSIKVDREERPDLDHVYQLICQLLTRSGGWPLSVFLTPDQRPFYAGTYYPPEDRYGRPGFPRLLRSIHDAFTNRRAEVDESADRLVQALSQVEQTPAANGQPPEPRLLADGARYLLERFDLENGGFGTAPKFPNPTNLELFFRHARASGDTEVLRAALIGLRKMAEGGIYDQLGGGFHRYSVDAHWSVPHFEKMLYDNALLVPLYLTGYQLDGNPAFARVVRETLAYVEREMTHPEGGFYSTQDADSEGEEGKFFVWTPESVQAVLGPEAPLLMQHLGVDDHGNFEHGQTVLYVGRTVPELAAALGRPAEEVQARLDAGRQRLFEAREQRVKPFRDEKVLTGWNGLMISAFARAAQVLDEPRYAQVAARAVALIEAKLRSPEGGLLRRLKDGRADIPGYLEDYAYYAQGLIDLYEATFDTGYLVRAAELARIMLQDFADPAGGFFLTAAGAEQLVHRPKEAQDSATPAAQSIAVQVLLRLHPFTGEERFRQTAEQTLATYQELMAEHPWGSASLLSALDLYLGAIEITLAGAANDDTVRGWLAQLGRLYLPNRILSVLPAEQEAVAPALAPAGSVPMWEGRTGKGAQPAAYVCRNFACSQPLHTWQEIAAQLPSST